MADARLRPHFRLIRIASVQKRINLNSPKAREVSSAQGHVTCHVTASLRNEEFQTGLTPAGLRCAYIIVLTTKQWKGSRRHGTGEETVTVPIEHLYGEPRRETSCSMLQFQFSAGDGTMSPFHIYKYI